MNNTVYLLLLLSIGIIFLIIIRKKSTKSELISFISTMIATLIGVLLAVSLSNIENTKKEKVDTIKLLKSASHVVERTYGFTEGLEKYMSEREKDSIKYTDMEIAALKKNNPIPYPDLMEPIISNEIISRNVTEFSLTKIYMILMNLRRTNDYDSVDTYERLLKELLLIFELEIEFQKGNINLENFNINFNLEIEDLNKKHPFSKSHVVS